MFVLNIKFSLFLIAIVLINHSLAISRQQLKHASKRMKKACMVRHKVTEGEVGSIEKGVFLDHRKVKCYIACIYTKYGVVRSAKLNYNTTMKQINRLIPPEMKPRMIAAVEKCRDAASSSKDLCESSFAAAKCLYEADPDNFFFP